MTDEYAKLHPEKTSKKVNKNLANQLLAFGIGVQPASDTQPASKPTIGWSKRLPRTFAEVLSMPMTHQDRAGFIESTAAEIKSIHDMGTYDPDEKLDESQMKISKIGMSKIVFTKKYHPDGSFDKYKSRIVFRGDRWYDLYANKTYAGTVMSETVRLMLSVAATEDMEIQSLDVKTAFLYGDVPESQYIYMQICRR